MALSTASMTAIKEKCTQLKAEIQSLGAQRQGHVEAIQSLDAQIQEKNDVLVALTTDLPEIDG